MFSLIELMLSMLNLCDLNVSNSLVAAFEIFIFKYSAILITGNNASDISGLKGVWHTCVNYDLNLYINVLSMIKKSNRCLVIIFHQLTEWNYCSYICMYNVSYLQHHLFIRCGKSASTARLKHLK